MDRRTPSSSIGIDRLLPPEVELVHGPGCPVCVTSLEMIDKAHAIARRPDVIFCSFGDMLRVPGSESDLLILKSRGADVRVVYSPLDCLKIARGQPEKQGVFFAIGFETTAPANAMAVWQAKERGVQNFCVLVSHVLVPPAMASILQSPRQPRAGVSSGPGHVCTVMGYREYEPIAERFRVPIVITGFEPIDLLEGILMTCANSKPGDAEVENQYAARGQPRRQPAGARPRSTKCSKSATANGAASARSRKRLQACATSSATTTRSGSSMSRRSIPKSLPSASAAWF